MTHCFGDLAEHPEDGSFSKAAADAASDSSTAGAAASAGADIVYSDTLPAHQANPKIVSVDPHKVCMQVLFMLRRVMSSMLHDYACCSACNVAVSQHRLIARFLFTVFLRL